MKLIAPRSARPFSELADRAGFTLAEVLLASVLGAIMLTALAVNTFGFTLNLDSLEQQAGVGQNPDPDPVLHIMTKDVREAYWATMPDSNTLDLASPTGQITEYKVAGSQLSVTRPNGDSGVVLKDFTEMTILPSYIDRLREGPVVNNDGKWHDTVAPAGTAIAMQVPAGGKLALGFVAPAVPSDVPGQAASSEQVLTVQTSIFDLPIGWISGNGSKKLQASLFESWAPGSAKPYQTALASAQIDLSSLGPEEVQVGGVYPVPSTTSALSLSAPLTPGVGYTIVLNATNSSQLVFKAVTVFPTTGYDQVSMLPPSSTTWTAQPMVIPFDVKGPWTETSTVTTSVISRVTLTVYPATRPLMQRSAALLSQAASDDPWLGVVPGQAAP